MSSLLRTETDNSRPLVTAIVPTYNCAEYLPRALNSVFLQTYDNIECVVIDDGSTDDTPHILEQYQDRIRLFRQENSGAAAARNLGLKKARGSLAGFLDADDYWHPTKIQKQVNVFLDHPSLALVSCGLQNQTGDPRQVLFAEDAANPCSSTDVTIYDDFLTVFRDPYLGTPTVMIPTALAHELGGFDEELPVGEDVDFWLRACYGRPYAHIPQPLAYIHLRTGSLTDDDEGYRHNLTVLDRAEQAWPDFAREQQAEFTRLRLSIYRNWAAACLVSGNGRKARAVIRDSRRYGRIPDRLTLMLKAYVRTVLPVTVSRRP